MKKNKISKNWINKQKRDIYVRESKIQGYRSRSAFKLIEIDKKFSLFKKNIKFLDLGAAPGGWAQVASKNIKNGKILSVDIKYMDPIDNVDFLKGDFTDTKIQEKIFNYFGTRIDLLVSDMALNTTGNKNLDSFTTGNLSILAMDFASNILKKEGIFVSKIFMGSIFDEIRKKAEKVFKNIKIFKPSSSRKESKENYIICKNLSN